MDVPDEGDEAAGGIDAGAGGLAGGDEEAVNEEEGILTLGDAESCGQTLSTAERGAFEKPKFAQHCFVAFDLLFLNGKVLTNQPLSARKEALTAAFTPEKGTWFSFENNFQHDPN